MAQNQTAQDSEQFFSRYDILINDALQRYHVPGLSIAVVDGDSILAKVGSKLKLTYRTFKNSVLMEIGLWHRSIPQRERYDRHFIQRCEHDESLHRSKCVFDS